MNFIVFKLTFQLTGQATNLESASWLLKPFEESNSKDKLVYI